jgi:hypothetical protein
VYEPHDWFSGGTFEFAALESSHVEFSPTIGRSPTVSSVNVQLKSVISNHDVVSIQVFLTSEGMSFEVEHGVAVGVLDELVDEETEVGVEELGVEGEEPKGDAEALAATVALEPTLITCLAIRAPMTAPAITMTATTAAIQNPAARC